MVNFGEKLLVSQYMPWALHYIDYNHLKQVLEDEYKDNKENRSDATSQTVSTRRTAAVSAEFLSQLYVQTERVVFFFLQEQGRITSELAECRRALLLGVNVSDVNELVSLEGKYVSTGLALLRLIKFIDLNVTGFRKILKKHDKLAQAMLSVRYLALRGDGGPTTLSRALSFNSRFDDTFGDQKNLIVLGNKLLQPLLNDDSIAALAAAYAAGIEDLRRCWRQHDLHHTPANDLENSSTRHIISAPNLQDLGGGGGGDDDHYNHNNNNNNSNGTGSPQYNMTTITSSSPPNGGGTTNRSYGDLQSMMMMDEQAEALAKRTNINPGQLLLQIHAARGRLHNTNEFVKLLGDTSLMFPVMEGESDETVSKTGSALLHRPSEFSNLLNLLSTFFYMANYYIVAPTSATYADRVGSDSSIASIIIGMTSVAALVSTLLYSWWTSYSYKSALIFASTNCVVGNILYGSGLPCKSLSLVMLGRLMTGFGSARSINRRYIADSYSQAERTAASAAFVTASALGMATGPAMASVLHLATEGSDSVYWQTENAPGWFMAVVWLIFLVCLIWKFEDPPRRCHPSNSRVSTTSVSDAEKQQQIGSLQEKKPLLGNHNDNNNVLEDVEQEEPTDSIIFNVPVIVTLIVYMVLKMVLEAVTSSEANLTALYFGWRAGQAGIHLAILALLIIPVNFCIAYFSRSYFDREMIIALLIAMFLGCLIILQWQSDPDNYTLPQYLVGSAMCFCCASALEGPNMSLLSKVIPRKWSVGIVNVGLLATESGTLGRVIGDLLLAEVGSHGLEELLNRAFGAYAAIVFGTLVLTLATYKWLVEPPDDEKDD